MNKYECTGCYKKCRSYGTIPEVKCNLPERKFYPARLKRISFDCYPTIAPRYRVEDIKGSKNRLMKCLNCGEVKDFSFFRVFKGKRLQVCEDCIARNSETLDKIDN